MAGLLFYFTLFYFILLFLFELTTQGRSAEKYHMTMLHITVTYQDVTRLCHMISVGK